MPGSALDLDRIGQPLRDSSELLSMFGRLEQKAMMVPVTHRKKHGSDDTRTEIRRAAEDSLRRRAPTRGASRVWRALKLIRHIVLW